MLSALIVMMPRPTSLVIVPAEFTNWPVPALIVTPFGPVMVEVLVTPLVAVKLTLPTLLLVRGASTVTDPLVAVSVTLSAVMLPAVRLPLAWVIEILPVLLTLDAPAWLKLLVTVTLPEPVKVPPARLKPAVEEVPLRASVPAAIARLPLLVKVVSVVVPTTPES